MLAMDNNGVSGSLPDGIENWSNSLEAIHLLSCAMNGTLPTEIGLLKELQKVNLNNNSWMGPIPSELGNLQKLNWISLGGPMNGTLPTEVGRLSNLRYFWLLGPADMQGTLPTEMGGLAQLGEESSLSLPYVGLSTNCYANRVTFYT
jgi:hypothetical protein